MSSAPACFVGPSGGSNSRRPVTPFSRKRGRRWPRPSAPSAPHSARRVASWANSLVGYVASATYGPLPDVIRMFRKRFPDVDLKLQNLRSVQQRQALVDRGIDVGIVRPQVADPRLIYEAIWRESVVVALPGNHPLARRATVHVSELATEPFVVGEPEAAGSFYDEVFTLCRRAGFTPRVAHRAPDVHAAIALVAAGLGIAPSRRPSRDSSGRAWSIGRFDRAGSEPRWAWRGDGTMIRRWCSSSGGSHGRRRGAPRTHRHRRGPAPGSDARPRGSRSSINPIEAWDRPTGRLRLLADGCMSWAASIASNHRGSPRESRKWPSGATITLAVLSTRFCSKRHADCATREKKRLQRRKNPQTTYAGIHVS